MDAQKMFMERAFRATRALYECAVDDLLQEYGNEFDPKALICRLHSNSDANTTEVTVLYKQVPVMWYVMNNAGMNLRYELELHSLVN